MPEYRRKKSHTGRRKRVLSEVQKPRIDFKVPRRKKAGKTGSEQETGIRVVRGRKGEKRKKLYVFALATAVVLLTVFIISVIAPVSLFESAQNITLSMGSSSFPVAISGNGIMNAVPKNRYYYVLTDTNIMAFTNGGKKIFSFVHGFSSPVLVTSETRALLFDQGGNTAVVYNLAGVVKTVESKNSIVAADIAKDGQYALVTKSDSYAATVSVYNRKGKSVYSINFAKDMVNNVDIASSGKKIAVSTVNTESGKPVSVLRIYDFKSADPTFKLDLGQDMAYDIENTGRGFFVTTHNKVRYIRWSNYNVQEFGLEGEISALRYSSSGFLAVYNKTNDKSDSVAVLFTNSGKKISEFEIKGAVSDIRFSRGRVYVMSDNSVTIFNKNGEILRSGNYGYGGVRISVTGSNTVCIITDNGIEESVIKKG